MTNVASVNRTTIKQLVLRQITIAPSLVDADKNKEHNNLFPKKLHINCGITSVAQKLTKFELTKESTMLSWLATVQHL